MSVATPILRAMRWTDIPDLARAETELFATDAWSEATWWAELAQRPRRHYVVLVDEEHALLAYGGVDLGGEVADIMTIAVLPAAQGRGFGDLLLGELAARAKASGAAYLMLEVRADNAPAIGLYERHDFGTLTVRERYYQPGDVDALVMRKALS